MRSFVDALRGVCAVTVTPFDRSGALDEGSIASLARHVAHGAVDTLTVGGSVGEFLSLTPAEALEALRVTLAAVDGAVPVLAATGLDIKSATERAQVALDAGAAGVMVHQPLQPFRSPDGWTAYHRTVADALRPAPVIVYLSDPEIGPHQIAELAEACPNVVGMKYAVPDPPRLASLVAAGGDQLAWLCGLGERWAPAFSASGADGFTSGLANANPGLAVEMFRALEAGGKEQRVSAWRRIEPFEALRALRGGAASVGTIKTALVTNKLIASATVRPPVSPLLAAEAELCAATVKGWPRGSASADPDPRRFRSRA
jgi:4-hydroxy-tetrahydrodipicolinate synthase